MRRSVRLAPYAGAALVFLAIALLMAILSLDGWSRWLPWASVGAVAVAIIWAIDRPGAAAALRRMQARPRITADEVATLNAAMATDTRPALR